MNISLLRDYREKRSIIIESARTRTLTHNYISLIDKQIALIINKTVLDSVGSEQFSGISWANIAFPDKFHVVDAFLSRLYKFANNFVYRFNFCHYSAPFSPFENQGLKLPFLSNLPTTEIVVKTNCPSLILSHSRLVILCSSGVLKYSLTQPLKGSIPCSYFKWLVRFLVTLRPHNLHIPRTYITPTSNNKEYQYLSFLHTHKTKWIEKR